MDIFRIGFTIVLIGFGLWVVNVKIPMQATVKLIFNAVIIGLLLLWLFQIFNMSSLIYHGPVLG